MAVTPRILDQNLFLASANTISADSVAPGLPVRYLRDQLPSKVWRSAMGWVIVAGFNDRIAFSSPGGGASEFAFVAAGTYVLGSELAVAIVAALEAADAAPVWACNYGITATNKFNISADINFDLFTTGGDYSIQRDLGYSEAPVEGTVSATADNAAYHSRHFIACDFQASTAITAAILLGDNVSASGTVKVQSSATSILAALTGVGVTQTLVDRGTFWDLYFASQSHRYVAFVMRIRFSKDEQDFLTFEAETMGRPQGRPHHRGRSGPAPHRGRLDRARWGRAVRHPAPARR